MTQHTQEERLLHWQQRKGQTTNVQQDHKHQLNQRALVKQATNNEGKDQPLPRVSIPQHEPSEAWGGPGSQHHNASGFTIATVGHGTLLRLMLPIPYTRQLGHREGRPRLRDARLERIAHHFGVTEPGPLLFPCKSIDWTAVFSIASSGTGSSQAIPGTDPFQCQEPGAPHFSCCSM